MPDPCASGPPPPCGTPPLDPRCLPSSFLPRNPWPLSYHCVTAVCVKQAYWQLPEVVGTRADVPFLSSWQLALTAHTHSPAALSTPAVPHRPADDSLLWANDADLVWEAVPTVDGESEDKGKSGPGAGRG